MSIAEVIRRNKPEVADTTVRTYTANVTRVMRNADQHLEIVKVTDYLDSLQGHIAEQLATALNAYDPDFNHLINRYRAASERIRESRLQRSTLRQRENWTTLKAFRGMLRLMRRELKTFGWTEHRLATAYVAWSIHMLFPMRNDLCTLELVKVAAETTPDRNFFVLSNGTIFLNRFKTAKSFKRRGLLPLKLQIQKKLLLEILRFLKVRTESKFLISAKNGRPLSRHAYRNLLLWSSRRYLGVSVGSTQFRHIYLTEFGKGNPTLAERKRVARGMQQLTIERQHSYELRDVE